MRARAKKSGFSLTELIVAMSIIAALAGIGLPAVNKLQKSFESSSRVRGVVGAAMSNARAMAQARSKYIGIRFQQTPQGNQYMVFIVLDNNGTSIADSFRPLIGRNPIRLPNQGFVMDMRLGRNAYNVDLGPVNIDVDINADSQITPLSAPTALRPDIDWFLTDMTSFSVIFSPAGKIVLHDVRTWAGAGDIFNVDTVVDTGDAMFYIDSYPDKGLGEETSRNNFIIIDKNDFNSTPANQRWSRYLQYLKPIYINPYTGELIN